MDGTGRGQREYLEQRLGLWKNECRKVGTDVRFIAQRGGTEHRGSRGREMTDIFGHTCRTIRNTEHFIHLFIFWQRGKVLSSYLETLSLWWSWDSGQAELELSEPGDRLGAVRWLLKPWDGLRFSKERMRCKVKALESFII